jgi:iron complex outermembrane receptor protein
VVGRAAVTDNWRLQGGLFHSYNLLRGDYSLLYRNTQPSGIADVNIRSRPPTWLSSWSGEMRATGLFSEGPRRHTVHLSAKGRVSERLFGGEDTVVYGPAPIGVDIPIAKPTFTLGPHSRDHVRHGTVGVSYVGRWLGIGEFSAGLQKAFYRRTVAYPARTSAFTRAEPWLYNATLAIEASAPLTFYAGYTRGLEDSAIAPENAINPGEAVGASVTNQVDAGLRYRLAPGTTLVLGVFQVKKPYFDRDSANLFTRVGDLSHRGIELSLSAAPVPDLKLVAGAMLLKARVEGATVRQGLIAAVPPGRPPAIVRLNANYGPPAWRGLSVNGQLSVEDAHFANRLNTVKISSQTTVDVGARYTFAISGATASLRFDVQNLTNSYIWTVNPVSGQYSPSPARRYILRMAADF